MQCPFAGQDAGLCDLRSPAIAAHHLAWHATNVLLPELDRLQAEGSDGRKRTRLMVTMDVPAEVPDDDVHFKVSTLLDDDPEIARSDWKVTGVVALGGGR